MSHFIVGPSSAAIWGKPDGCTAYPQMAERYPETERKEEALQGDASHEIAESLIHAGTRANLGKPKFEDLEGKPSSAGVLYTKEMYEAAELYANDVIEVMRKVAIFGGDSLGIEKKISIPKVHPQQYGTVDAFIFDWKNLSIYIWDYKFGMGLVEVYENLQLINYAAGLLTNVDGLLDQQIKIHFRVVQPRAFHRDGPIREWVVKASDLRGYINILSSNAHASLSGKGVLRSGPHCKHCPARHSCEAALKGGLSLYEAVADPMPTELSDEALGVQLRLVKRALSQLEFLKLAYEEKALSRIRSGASINLWRPEPTFGRQKWARPDEEVKALGDLVGKSLEKKSVVTPKQAQALGVPPELVKAYSTTPRIGTTLVPESGERAKLIFSQLKEV